uniref:CSON007125 protein n=1 Tax=Culicoides sonorensis TaxID=179676 RepID=A0A336MWJ9_CULSO
MIGYVMARRIVIMIISIELLNLIQITQVHGALPCEGSPEYYGCEIPITDCTGNASCDTDQCEKFCADLGALPVPDSCNEYFCFCKPCDANCCWTAVRAALYERENCANMRVNQTEMEVNVIQDENSAENVTVNQF